MVSGLDEMFGQLDKDKALRPPTSVPTVTGQKDESIGGMFSILDQDKKIRATSNLTDAQQIKPDQAAQALKASRALGIPAPAVEENLEQAQQSVQLQSNVSELDNSPKLTGFLADNPLAARLAQDDLPNLSAFEKLMSAAVDVGKYAVSAPGAPGGGLVRDAEKFGRAITSGLLPRAGSQLYGAAAVLPGIADQIAQTMDDAAAFVTGTERRKIVGTPGVESWLLAQQKSARAVADRWTGLDPNAGLIERSVISGFESAGQNLLTIPLGFANTARVSGEKLMLGTMGLMVGGQSYGEGREAGLSPFQSTLYGMQDATAEIVTEKYLGAAGLLRQMKAGAPAAKLFAYEMMKEVPGEIGATLWQNFNKWTNVNPDKTVAEFLDEQPEAVVQTVISTLVGGTTQIGAVKLMEKAIAPGVREQIKADQAEQAAAVMQQLDQLTVASKLRERDPDSFNQFVKQLAEDGPVKDLYISSEALMQSGINLQEMAAMVPSMSEQIQAVATGSDLRIPVEDFMTQIAGTELSKALMPHLKTEVDGMSQTEAQEYIKTQGERLQQEVEKTLQDQEARDEFRNSVKAVETNIMAQLDATGRFTGDVNQPYSTLIAARYGTLASQLGITAEQAFEKYPLRIQAQGVDGNTLSQAMEPLGEQPTVSTDAAWEAKDRDRNTDKGSTDLKALTEDIKKNGIKNPITITVSTKDGTGYVTDGNNRLAAAKAAGIKNIPYRLETTDVKFTPEESAKAKPVKDLGIDLAQFKAKPKSKQAQEAEDWLKSFNEGALKQGPRDAHTEQTVEYRKRISVLESIMECMG
jgi:hypothetical protein